MRAYAGMPSAAYDDQFAVIQDLLSCGVERGC